MNRKFKTLIRLFKSDCAQAREHNMRACIMLAAIFFLFALAGILIHPAAALTFSACSGFFAYTFTNEAWGTPDIAALIERTWGRVSAIIRQVRADRERFIEERTQ